MRPATVTTIVTVAAIAAVAVTVAARPATAGGDAGPAAARLVATDAGYRTVIRDLLGWHGTRHNGCVAFVTTALRQVGVEVPDETPAGPWSNPARVTFSLDRHLADQGWARIDDPAALRAGDVVFTTGAPDHVMLFHGWANAHAQVARVSDNQRHGYRRPLRPAPGSALAGFGFARRAPTAPAPRVDRL